MSGSKALVLKKDMTSGAIAPIILKFMFPLFIGNIFQQLYNVADRIIASRVNEYALGAIGCTLSLHFVIIGFVIGLTAGCCIYVSHSFGAGDFSLMKKYIANGIYICVFFTVIITLVCGIFTKSWLVAMKTPDVFMEMAYDYIIIIFLGVFTIVAYNYLAALLKAIGDSKIPLVFLMIACFINVVLDLFLVLKLGMSIKGAGYATVIAQGSSALLCLIYIKYKYPILHLKKEDWKFSFPHIKKLFMISFPMGFQFSITAIGTVLIQVALNSFGENVVSGITIANTISMFTLQPYDSLGLTMAVFFGQNIGAKKPERLRKGMKTAFKILLIYTAFVMLLLIFGGKSISLLLMKERNDEVLYYAVKFLLYFAYFYLALGLVLVLRNTIQGMGFGFIALMAGIAELLIRTIVSLFLVKQFGFNILLWTGPLAWIGADLVLIPAYFYCIRKVRKKLEVLNIPTDQEDAISHIVPLSE